MRKLYEDLFENSLLFRLIQDALGTTKSTAVGAGTERRIAREKAEHKAKAEVPMDPVDTRQRRRAADRVDVKAYRSAQKDRAMRHKRFGGAAAIR